MFWANKKNQKVWLSRWPSHQHTHTKSTQFQTDRQTERQIWKQYIPASPQPPICEGLWHFKWLICYKGVSCFLEKLKKNVSIWASTLQNQQNCMCTQRRLRSAWASAKWSESWLHAQWAAKDPSLLHAESEDSDQTGRMPRLIWDFATRTCHFVVLSSMLSVKGWLNWSAMVNLLHYTT